MCSPKSIQDSKDIITFIENKINENPELADVIAFDDYEPDFVDPALTFGRLLELLKEN